MFKINKINAWEQNIVTMVTTEGDTECSKNKRGFKGART